MRLDTLSADNWALYSLHVDTLVVPVAPIILNEKGLGNDIYKVVTQVAVTVEEILKGRVLLFPTTFYGDTLYLQKMLQSLSSSGFRHKIVLLHDNCRLLGEEISLNKGIQTHFVKVDPDAPTIEEVSKDIVEQIIRDWKNEI